MLLLLLLRPVSGELTGLTRTGRLALPSSLQLQPVLVQEMEELCSAVANTHSWGVGGLELTAGRSAIKPMQENAGFSLRHFQKAPVG